MRATKRLGCARVRLWIRCTEMEHSHAEMKRDAERWRQQALLTQAASPLRRAVQRSGPLASSRNSLKVVVGLAGNCKPDGMVSAAVEAEEQVVAEPATCSPRLCARDALDSAIADGDGKEKRTSVHGAADACETERFERIWRVAPCTLARVQSAPSCGAHHRISDVARISTAMCTPRQRARCPQQSARDPSVCDLRTPIRPRSAEIIRSI